MGRGPVFDQFHRAWRITRIFLCQDFNRSWYHSSLTAFSLRLMIVPTLQRRQPPLDQNRAQPDRFPRASVTPFCARRHFQVRLSRFLIMVFLFSIGTGDTRKAWQCRRFVFAVEIPVDAGGPGKAAFSCRSGRSASFPRTASIQRAVCPGVRRSHTDRI